jgi:hypothetical protein
MKPALIALLSLFLTTKVLSQTGLFISPGTDLFIGTGAVLSTDSLVFIPSSDFTFSGQNAVTRNISVVHPTANPYIQRVFHLSSIPSSYNGTISIYYRDPELNGLPENALTLNIHNGTSWIAYNSNVTRDAVNNVVTTTGLANIPLSELTLANLSSPLPLRYILFNALCTGTKIKLAWKTAQEFNTNIFEIERSADGRVWQPIGSVPAAGSSTSELSYSWIDDQPITNGLYRIAANDIDGRKQFSSVIRVSCSLPDLFAVYPNPVQHAATINVSVTEPSLVTLRVYDAKGALIKQSQTNLMQGINVVQLDMTHLSAGTYTLTAQWNDMIKAVKLIKE